MAVHTQTHSLLVPTAHVCEQTLLAAHASEKHVLVWRGGRGLALLRQGVCAPDLLRPLWQVGCPYVEPIYLLVWFILAVHPSFARVVALKRSCNASIQGSVMYTRRPITQSTRALRQGWSLPSVVGDA